VHLFICYIVTFVTFDVFLSILLSISHIFPLILLIHSYIPLHFRLLSIFIYIYLLHLFTFYILHTFVVVVVVVVTFVVIWYLLLLLMLCYCSFTTFIVDVVYSPMLLIPSIFPTICDLFFFFCTHAFTFLFVRLHLQEDGQVLESVKHLHSHSLILLLFKTLYRYVVGYNLAFTLAIRLRWCR